VLLLVVFIPIHTTFSNPTMLFQTQEEDTMAHFMIERYPWNADSLILLDTSTLWFIAPQINSSSSISVLTDVSSSGFQGSNIEAYHSIAYSPRLIQELREFNVSNSQVSQTVSENYDVIYNSGSCYVAEKIG
jgi:hypothetical protein